MKVIKILIISNLLSSNYAHAYVDPVTITSLLSLLVAAVLSSLYFIKLKISNFFEKTVFFLKIYFF